MDLSIIVVDYQTPDLAVRAISNARSTAGDLTVEEILVDNGAGHARDLRAGRPQAQVLALSQNHGFGAGVNAALDVARGRHALILNSDAFCHGSAAAQLSSSLDAHPRAAVVGPKLLNPDGTQQLNAYRRFPSALTVFVDYCFPLSAALYGGPLHPYLLPRSAYRAGPVAHVMGASLAVRMEAVVEVGGLDDRYFLYLEETDWQRRLTAAGWEVHLEPAAKVTHLGGASAGDYSFASDNFLASLERYHQGRERVRLAAIAGSGISLAAARLAQRARPSDGRFGRLAAACSRAMRGLRARRWA